MLIAGNWKMNGARAEAASFIEELTASRAAGTKPNCDLLICPPFTLLDAMKEGLAQAGVQLGAQDCHFAGAGAHTGDVAAAMLAETGCSHVIVGHSERRSDHGEDDDFGNHDIARSVCTVSTVTALGTDGTKVIARAI